MHCQVLAINYQVYQVVKSIKIHMMGQNELCKFEIKTNPNFTQ